jgi:DNA-binding response OmpR family regulator
VFNILIVDDDRAICAMLKRLLEHAGYTTQCAHNSAEVGELVAANKFHLAIIDWNRGGGLSGIQVGRELRRQGMATFLLSGYTKEDVRAEWRDPLEGFVQFLEKPINKTDLLDKVARIKASMEDTEP